MYIPVISIPFRSDNFQILAKFHGNLKIVYQNFIQFSPVRRPPVFVFQPGRLNRAATILLAATKFCEIQLHIRHI
jgi:hypothetical protein